MHAYGECERCIILTDRLLVEAMQAAAPGISAAGELRCLV